MRTTVQTFQREIGGRTLTLQTGHLALQANGAVTVRYGDTVVLVTACMSKPREGINFFPLTVDFEERLYAAGKIPGSWFRREGRPSTPAILTARLTDRPLRPLFPKGFRNEVQIIITALSADKENDHDILGIIGASTALVISDIPFNGPVGACRIGYIDGEFIVNPTFAQRKESRLDLVVAGTKDAVLMVEAGANEVPEEILLEAIERAQEVNREVIALQEEMAAVLGRPKAEWQAALPDPQVAEAVREFVRSRSWDLLAAAKDERETELEQRRQELLAALGETYPADQLLAALEEELRLTVRRKILDEGVRPDGRRPEEIRPISAAVGILPRTHGSGLFTRGQTQVLTIATLGSLGERQELDTIEPEESKRFIHHYNFPPFSTGEVRPLRGPSRREIGHGALAERALEPVIPSEEEFPYTIRLVSEVLSSNGSTSMASVCGSTLSLMDAGVPIKAPVAGIAMGLVTDAEGRYAVLTDIAGLEDAFGDMDFKVAGTAAGVTALQLDIKLTSGIPMPVLRDALQRAREARLYILERMLETIPEARAELSPYAPRMYRIQIPVEKIGAVIGPGGRVIRSIIDETKCSIDISDDGTVFVGSPSEEAARRAIEIIEGLTKDVQVGEIYTGRVTRLTSFGAFVEILPGKEGLVRTEELADYRVHRPDEVVRVGDEVMVMVTEVDQFGRINLSRRAVLEGRQPGELPQRPQQQQRPGQRPPGRPQQGRPRGDGRPRPGGGGRLPPGPPPQRGGAPRRGPDVPPPPPPRPPSFR
jgi:polyribonucleotide nucleotidyltransferase